MSGHEDGRSATPDGGDDAGGLPVRRRRDCDDCACVRCRGLAVTALHRDLFDTVRWSGGLCRRYPSIVGLALVLVAASEATDRFGPRYLPLDAVESLEILVAVALFVGLRAYVATLAARDLTGDDCSTLRWWGRAVGRSLALVFVVFLILTLVSLLWSAVGLGLFIVFLFADVNPMQTVGTLPVLVVMVLLFVLPIAVVLFGCWFALEASIIGGYGPLASIRVSLAITTSYWDKLLRVVAGLTLGVGLGYAGGVVSQRLPAAGGLGPVLDAVGVVAGAVSLVVWFAVSGHLYVQAVAETGVGRR